MRAQHARIRAHTLVRVVRSVFSSFPHAQRFPPVNLWVLGERANSTLGIALPRGLRRAAVFPRIDMHQHSPPHQFLCQDSMHVCAELCISRATMCAHTAMSLAHSPSLQLNMRARTLTRHNSRANNMNTAHAVVARVISCAPPPQLSATLRRRSPPVHAPNAYIHTKFTLLRVFDSSAAKC